MVLAIWPLLILLILCAVFVLINVISFFYLGKILIKKNLWAFVQVFEVALLPVLFLILFDIPYKNDCCNDSAVFSPEHRLTPHLLIFLCISVYIINLFRKNIFPPLAEVFINAVLILGLLFNFILLKHLTEIFYWIVLIPIILLFLYTLADNQKKLYRYIRENNYTSNSFLGKISLSILQSKPIIKFPALLLLLAPLLLVFTLFLMLFGQKPDSLIRAFTDTYKHGFSQWDYMCANVECGGHFLCSVGANGHKNIVKPIRYGERNGNKIICNRQLLISNAFEELVQEKMPEMHMFIRRNYNKVGNKIHQHYHIFNNKAVADAVYILMKPLELFFLFVLYTFDKKPENRIAVQYLNKNDRDKIKSVNK